MESDTSISKRRSGWDDWTKTEKGRASRKTYLQSEKGRKMLRAKEARRRKAGKRSGGRGDVKAQRLRAKERLKLWLRDLKSTLFCIRCGFSHPAALHFHHEGAKNDQISNLVQKGRKAALLREISLCVVMCANCHSIFHYEENRVPPEG